MPSPILPSAVFVLTVISLCAGSITAFSVYGHLFLSQLRYTQLQVNVVSIAAELAMYLPVPFWGYVCDRYSPGTASASSAFFFGAGYLLAAFTYQHGPPPGAGGHGWPFALMVVAFVGVGVGTSCMYLSAVTTCAKNFGRGNHKGFALAMPIAAFGLGGMWQSQVGSQLLYETMPDGSKGDVDVFQFFVFLAITLSVVGLVGSLGLQVVDGDELIDEAVDELERSGLLEDSAHFQRNPSSSPYGALIRRLSSDDHPETDVEELRKRQDEEARKKTWLLNEKTRSFLTDRTMWWLAGGFLLVTGPGEAFMNNARSLSSTSMTFADDPCQIGTIIGTLYPPSTDHAAIPTTPATHVSIVAVTSTLARILTGTLSDLIAPSSDPHSHPSSHRSPSAASSPGSLALHSTRFTISRVVFLVLFALILSLGQVLLASGMVQNHGSRLWIVSALIGAGYGAVFSLVPIILSVVWGVENFGTNWGIVAMVPALGATVWGLAYSAVYQRALGLHADAGVAGHDRLACHGMDCYAPTFWAMAGTVWLACGLWLWAWKGPNGWSRRGIAV